MTEKNNCTFLLMNKLRRIYKYFLMSELHNTDILALDSVCHLYLEQ